MNTKNTFQDHGIAACAEEPRFSAVCHGRDGRYYLVMASHGFLVSIDMEARTAKQVMFPGIEPGSRAGNHWPFGGFASHAGYFYTGADKLFMEFDPVTNEFTYHTRLENDNIKHAGWCMCEAPDGLIYFGCVKPYLYGFDPAKKTLTCFGCMDETQTYLGSLAADEQGFLYCGIATETCSLIAFHPGTGEKRVTYSKEAQGICTQVVQGYGHRAYVSFNGAITNTTPSDKQRYYTLLGGEIGEAAEDIQCEYAGGGFHTTHLPEPGMPRVLATDMIEHEARYIHPVTGEEVTLSFDYESPGAELSPLALGPDGKIYGTTNHPIELYTYDPDTAELKNHGMRPFAKRINGWGNICAYAAQGPILGGAAYCGGFIVRIDTREPICREPDDVNPHCEAICDLVFRPRSAAAYPDGRTLIFGGFTVNGVTGGGLCLYDTVSRTVETIPNDDIAKYHSVMSIEPLPNGEVLLGTTVEAPCGGHSHADSALLCLLDMKTKKVRDTFCPIPGAFAISHMKADSRGIIHGITHESVYFAYDPAQKRVLASQELQQYGRVVRDGMQPGQDGFLYGLLSDGVYRINPENRRAEVIARPPAPITAGMAIRDGVIYFGCGTHFCSYTI